MTEDIPPDFDKHWDMADVVLHTQNSDGKELHACKSVLAVFSPYFRALFFHDFKEKCENEVNMEHDYEAVKEILRIIHQVNVDYSPTGQKQYDSAMLTNMYRIADLYLFPSIRKLCLDQMKARPDVPMAVAALNLGLHEDLMAILAKLNSTQLSQFMATNDDTDFFSKKDITFFYDRIEGTDCLVDDPDRVKSNKVPVKLEDIAHVVKDPRVDLTGPWMMSDVVVIANNSNGRRLYANKTVIEMVSRNFHKAVKKTADDQREMEDAPEFTAEVDVDYSTMKEILSIVHHCNMDYSAPGPKYHLILLHDMYVAAEEDQLDIPLIRKMCVDKLLEQPTPDCLDVMFTLGLENDIKESLLKKLTAYQVRDWVFTEDESLAYNSCGEDYFVTTEAEEAVLSMNVLRNMFEKLRATF